MNDDARKDKANVTRRDGIDPHKTVNVQPTSGPEVPASCPQQIGRYAVEALLGVGGFGHVFLATDPQLKRRVAIKVPHSHLISNPADTQSYLAEAQMLASLDHPHIVPVYDVGTTEAMPCYVVSKYVEGTDLAKRIKQSRFTHVEAARLVATVAEALHYAHTHGLVHRDVKPGNILLDGDGSPYVVDFGLALREADLGRGSRFAGTPAYMSPEQARGEGHRVDGRTDVYSLGAVLYELLVGRRAFAADSQAELLELTATQEPKPPRQIDDRVPKELERICLKALSRRASARYTTAKDLADDLKHFLDQAVTTSGVPTTLIDETRHGAASARAPATDSGGGWSAIDSGSRPIRVVPKGLRSLVSAEIDDVPAIIDEMDDYRRWADGRLTTLASEERSDPKTRLRVGLALLPVDSTQVAYVRQRLLTADPTEVAAIGRMLRPYKETVLEAYWDVLQSRVDGEGPQRLRAACVLATMDSESQRWQSVSDDVVAQLVRVRPAFISYWQNALKPVRTTLAPTLSRVSRDPSLTSVERSLATDLLTDYAADLPEVLADAIAHADDDQFERFFPLVERHGNAAASLLKDVLTQQPTFDWNDAPPDASWSSPDPAWIRSIEESEGMVAERFAYCQTMPMQVFLTTAERLRSTGYRPTRVRPYMVGADVRVAAVWERDGVAWELKTGSADEIRSYGDKLPEEHWCPVDVASWIQTSESGEPAVYVAALWSEQGAGSPERMLLIDLNLEQLAQQQAEIEEAGYNVIERVSSVYLDGGSVSLSTILSREEGASETYEQAGIGYSGDLHLGLLQVDARVSQAPKPQSIGERFAQEIKEAEAVLAQSPSDFAARTQRAEANYRLGNEDKALEELSALAKENHRDMNVWLDLAILHAHAGREGDANNALARFKYLCTSADAEMLLEALTIAYLQPDVDWTRRLEAEVLKRQSDPTLLIASAQVYAMASRSAGDTQKSQSYVRRAVELVEQAVTGGYNDFGELLKDPDLEAIKDDVGFAKLLEQGGLDRKYTAVWRESGRFESTELHGPDPANVVTQSRDLMADGYRPISVSACAFDDGRYETATVWHRPIVTGEERVALAKRKANAAIALLLLGQPADVWPVLKHSADPRARTYLIHQIARRRSDPPAIVDRLEKESDLSVRAALSVVVGICGPEAYPPDQRDSVVLRLSEIYRSHPDPGLHAAARWALYSWDCRDLVTEIDGQLQENETQLTARPSADQRRWYVTSQGQTMVVIDGGEFLMGTPHSDPERYSDEVYHAKIVGRRFALAATEVTRAQWIAFQRGSDAAVEDLANHAHVLELSRTEDSPIMAVTWYEAAAYCNWLSEKEGISKDQWCYERNDSGNYAVGMRAKPGYLKLRGYRLPQEAEWEFACRAGTTSVRYYGDTVELLPKYGWFEAVSDKRSHPTALLIPNDFGLFDMLGNVHEWCHEDSMSSMETKDDVEDAEPISDEETRVMRGGAYDSLPTGLRSAFRNYNQPTIRQINIGFRVARSYP